MRELILKKTEGKFFICEDKEGKFFAIEISEIPTNLRAGDAIVIDSDGIITAKV